MKLLLCCTLVPAKYETEIREISNAANRFLSNLSSQLEVHNSVKILSYIGISIDDKIKREIKNEKYIQYFFKTPKLLGGIWKMFRTIWSELSACDYVVTYNVVYAWMAAPLLAKLKGKKSVLILADYSPPESYAGKKQQIYSKVQGLFIGKYDYVIGLSDKTMKYLKPNQKFMCMEGGISELVYNKFSDVFASRKDKIVLMYSGILEKVTGIDLLIEAFKSLNMSNVELIITGDGSMAEWITDTSKKYANIHYLGCILYEDYIEKLKQADILINPRNMNLPENANNFPSKIMEFLATGKQIISTKFPGWERYQSYIEFCDSDSDSIKNTIKQCVMTAGEWTESDYKKNRNYAKKFLWSSQVKSVMDFLVSND